MHVQCFYRRWPKGTVAGKRHLAAALLRLVILIPLFVPLPFPLSILHPFISQLVKTWHNQFLLKNGSLGQRVLRSIPNACACCFRYRHHFFFLGKLTS